MVRDVDRLFNPIEPEKNFGLKKAWPSLIEIDLVKEFPSRIKIEVVKEFPSLIKSSCLINICPITMHE